MLNKPREMALVSLELTIVKKRGPFAKFQGGLAVCAMAKASHQRSMACLKVYVSLLLLFVFAF